MKLRALVSFGDAAGTRQPGDVYEESDTVAAIRIKQGLCVPAGDAAPEAAVIATDQAERAVMAPPTRKAAARKPVARRKT